MAWTALSSRHGISNRLFNSTISRRANGAGDYEEFWAAQKKQNNLHGPHLTLTKWRTEDGKHYFKHTGGPLPPKIVIDLIRSRIVNPLPAVEEMAKGDFAKRTEVLGSVKLICVSLSHLILAGPPSISHPAMSDGSYCFAEAKPILRISVVLGGIQSLAKYAGSFSGSLRGEICKRYRLWQATSRHES